MRFVNKFVIFWGKRTADTHDTQRDLWDRSVRLSQVHHFQAKTVQTVYVYSMNAVVGGGMSRGCQAPSSGGMIILFMHIPPLLASPFFNPP